MVQAQIVGALTARSPIFRDNAARIIVLVGHEPCHVGNFFGWIQGCAIRHLDEVAYFAAEL